VAASENSYYIEEEDRFSGILVLGPLPAGAAPGALITIGGEMGLNANEERALVNPATVLESAPVPGRIPPPLYMTIRDLSGSAFNAYTPGVTDHQALSNVGILVAVIGHASSVGEFEFMVSDGSQVGPIRVISQGVSLGDLADGDMVILKGIASLELAEGVRKPILRIYSADGLTNLH